MNAAVVREGARSGHGSRWRRVTGAPPMFSSPAIGEPVLAGVWRGNRTFEDFSVKTRVSADGQFALRTAVEGYNHFWRLSDRDAAVRDDDTLGGNPWARSVPCGADLLQLRGAQGSARWFRSGHGAALALNLPESITPVASPDGSRLLYFEMSPVFRTEHPGSDLWIGTFESVRQLQMPGPILGACFAPDADIAWALVRQPNGASSLLSVSSSGADFATVARDLDAPPYPPGSVGIAATRTHVYLPLVGPKPPDDLDRQKPIAARLVNVFRIDASGTVEPVVHCAADLADIAIGGGQLHWVRSIVVKSVVALPRSGGDVHHVAEAGIIPEWSPEGDRIAFTIGQFRLADWGIDLDSHVVSVDDRARPLTEPTVLVAGSHEDFTLTWSPCGRWIAYHTHRAPTNSIEFYDAHGAHDAVFVRAAEDPQAPETEVSENGWEIFQPRWSPDGRVILYSSWNRKGHPGIYDLWAVDFDPETGRKVGHRRVPMPEGLVSPCWAGWSPDARELVIEDACDIGERALWIISADGSSGRKIHQYQAHTYGGADYARDGRHIVFSGLDERDRMALYEISVDGGTARKLTDDDHNIVHPVVSPGGRWIAATRIATTQELWRAPLQG